MQYVDELTKVCRVRPSFGIAVFVLLSTYFAVELCVIGMYTKLIARVRHNVELY